MNYFFICLYTLTVQLLRDVPTDWKPGSSCTTMRWSLRWNSGISGKNGGRLPCMCQIFIYIYVCMYVCMYVCIYVDINNCPFSTSIDRWFPIGTSQCVFQDGSLSTADELRLLLSKRDSHSDHLLLQLSSVQSPGWLMIMGAYIQKYIAENIKGPDNPTCYQLL